MARRTQDLVSLSFLDVLMSALGAVIFLFIIVPKIPNAPNEIKPQIAKAEGTSESTLDGSKSANENAVENSPKIIPALAVQMLYSNPLTSSNVVLEERVFSRYPSILGGNWFTRNYQSPQKNRAFNATQSSTKEAEVQPETKKSVDLTTKKKEEVAIAMLPMGSAPAQSTTPTLQSINKPSQAAATSPVLKQPEDVRVKEMRRPTSPCRVAFEVAWDSPANNVDLFVFKGKEFVCGRFSNRSNPKIGDWDSGKSRNRLINNDLRTNQEAVRQFSSIVPGEYRLFVQYKETNKPEAAQNLTLTGLIYTKNDFNVEKSQSFSFKLTFNPKEKVYVGTVIVQADGTFTFDKNLAQL